MAQVDDAGLLVAGAKLWLLLHSAHPEDVEHGAVTVVGTVTVVAAVLMLVTVTGGGGGALTVMVRVLAGGGGRVLVITFVTGGRVLVMTFVTVCAGGQLELDHWFHPVLVGGAIVVIVVVLLQADHELSPAEGAPAGRATADAAATKDAK